MVELLSGKAAVIDATVGAGGHSEALLEAGVGLVLGIDRDESALGAASALLSRFGKRFRGETARFSRWKPALAGCRTGAFTPLFGM